MTGCCCRSCKLHIITICEKEVYASQWERHEIFKKAMHDKHLNLYQPLNEECMFNHDVEVYLLERMQLNIESDSEFDIPDNRRNDTHDG